MNPKMNITKRYNDLKPFMNERMRRLWGAAEANALGHGGIGIVSEATGISRTTLSRGIKELESGADIDRIRRSGGGRKKLSEKNPELEKALLDLVEPTVRGEPDSPLLWTTKSTRNLAAELRRQGYKISHTLAGNILKSNNFSLQANRKTDEGSSHPDRDMQFQYIHDRVMEFQKDKQPVISVDTKKKELIGNFKNNGREWKRKGKADKVNVYDFPQNAEGKAIPYGVYDISLNKGWVNVGTDNDTSEFAVQSIHNWWNHMGKEAYPGAKRLLITADGGGSNGSRRRLWKKELQQFANETGMDIWVCHFPPGTSKWNKIEHSLFSFITKNWRGKLLVSYQPVINLIGSTKTETGLEVKCYLDTNKYETGIKVSDEEFNKIIIVKNDFHGEWNYIIMPF